MKSLLRLSSYALLSTFLLLGAACGKKPQRPNPGQTVLGSGGADYIDPASISTDSSVESRGGTNYDRAKAGILPSIYFDFDSAAVRRAERAKLSQAVDYLNQHPAARLVLVGRADWRGTSEYNLGLGDRRANAVLKFLGTLGVDPSKLETVSKGDLEAKENASTDEAQQDRRVDLLVLD